MLGLVPNLPVRPEPTRPLPCLQEGCWGGTGGECLSTQCCPRSGCHAVNVPQPQDNLAGSWRGQGKCSLGPPLLVSQRAGQLWPLGITLARANQLRRGPAGLKASILGLCRQQLSSTMLTAMWGEPAATQPEMLGLPGGGRTGR